MFLMYLIYGTVLLPLAVAFRWTGIQAFSTVRRALAVMRACPQCDREVY
jgi:hypothetical protein